MMEKIPRKDGYDTVGPYCEPFDYEIDLAQAQDMRDFTVWEFFNRLKRTKTPLVNETEDKTACSVAFHGRPSLGSEMDPSTFVGVLLHHNTEENWSMKMLHAKMRRSETNFSNRRIQTVLGFEVVDGILYRAYREVKIFRCVGELTVDTVEGMVDDMSNDVHTLETQRKVFQQPVDSEACERAKSVLTRAAKRAHSMGLKR